MTKGNASLTLAVWQGASEPGDVEKNLRKIEALAEQATDSNADLVVFPECFLTGYYTEADLVEIATKVDDHCLATLAAISERTGITLVVGAYELTEGGLYNSAFIFDPELGMVGAYRKQMLYGDWEKKNFEPGTQPLVFGCQGLKVGVLICFDVEFPERVRELAKSGAELLVVPTALMKPYGIVSTVMIPTRALENGIFAAYANRIGSEAGLEYVGGSCIVGPDGSDLARLGSDEAELLIEKIDLAELESVRTKVAYLEELPNKN